MESINKGKCTKTSFQGKNYTKELKKVQKYFKTYKNYALLRIKKDTTRYLKAILKNA